MTAEIIAVGSELLTPQRVDTNSLFLTRKLNERGIEVVRKTIIGDDRQRLALEIRRARESSEVVIMTGGLGPTLDDLSRDAAADALGRELVFHQQIVDWIEERFRRRGRKMADVNRRQAYILEGAEIIPNARGTAPGQWFEDNTGILMLLPGPPRELEPMFAEQCMPRFDKIESPYQYYTVSMRVTGVSESDLDQRIGPIYSVEQRVATTILSAPGDIQIHLRARAARQEEARAIAEELAVQIEEELGQQIYTRKDEPLEEVVGRLFHEQGMTLAVAESCTGGLLAERITAIPGASRYFAGGFVSYTEDAKINWLGVDQSAIEDHGAVSSETAEAMARAVWDKARASVGAAITGVAGPGGGSEKTPVGTVFIGIATESGVSVEERHFGGERELIRSLAAQKTLELLLRIVR